MMDQKTVFNFVKATRATKQINPNDIVPAKVLRKTAKDAYFDLGVYGVGRLYGREYLLSRDAVKQIKLGDDVMVKVLEVGENEDWDVTLRGTLDLDKWQRLTRAMQEKQTLELPIKQVNWGGVIVELEGINGFVPVSQLSLAHYPRVEGGNKNLIAQELQKLMGQTLKLRVIDVDPRSQKLILSERAAEETLIKELIARYKAGDVVEGEISGLTKFGAFFAFGNPPLEGLIHISELSYLPVADPNELLKVHETRKAKIIKIENDRIFLSLKELEKEAAEAYLAAHATGDVTVTVAEIKPELVKVRLTPDLFGALAEFTEGITTGQSVTAKILGIRDNRLTLKQA